MYVNKPATQMGEEIIELSSREINSKEKKNIRNLFGY